MANDSQSVMIKWIRTRLCHKQIIINNYLQIYSHGYIAFFSDRFDDRVILLDIDKKNCAFSIEWPIDMDVKSKN